MERLVRPGTALAVILLQSVIPIMIKAGRSDLWALYVPVSLTFASELIKVAAAGAVVLFRLRHRVAEGRGLFSLTGLWSLAVPAALYFVSNLATIYTLPRMKAYVFNALLNTRIIFSALFSRCLLGRHYSGNQLKALLMVWAAAALLSFHNHQGLGEEVGYPLSAVSMAIGVASISALGGVTMERCLRRVKPKSEEETDLWTQQMVLAAFSAYFALFEGVVVHYEAVFQKPGLFHNWHPSTVLTAVLMAAMGLLVGVVLREYGIVLRLVIGTLSLALNIILEVIFLGATASVTDGLSISILIFSSSIFSGLSVSEKATPPTAGGPGFALLPTSEPDDNKFEGVEMGPIEGEELEKEAKEWRVGDLAALLEDRGRRKGGSGGAEGADPFGEEPPRVSTRTRLLLLLLAPLTGAICRGATSRQKPETQLLPERPMYFATMATAVNAPMCRVTLLSSLANNVELTVLGLGAYYPRETARRYDLGDNVKSIAKLLSPLEYLAHLHDDHVVLFCDAYDVYFQQDMPTILSRYRAMGSPEVVFSTETNCWPPDIAAKHYCERYPPHPNGLSMSFINSGAFMGTVRGLRRLIQAFLDDRTDGILGRVTSDDQGLVVVAFLDFPDQFQIQLDYNEQLFMSVHESRQFLHLKPQPPPRPVDFDEEEETIIISSSVGGDSGSGGGRSSNISENNLTAWEDTRNDAVPSLIHFNGGGKPYMNEISGSGWYFTPEGKLRAEVWEDIRGKNVHIFSLAKDVSFEDLCGSYLTGILPDGDR